MLIDYVVSKSEEPDVTHDNLIELEKHMNILEQHYKIHSHGRFSISGVGGDSIEIQPQEDGLIQRIFSRHLEMFNPDSELGRLEEAEPNRVHIVIGKIHYHIQFKP